MKYSGKNCFSRDSLGFKVYLMKWNKGRKDCTVEIEEM